MFRETEKPFICDHNILITLFTDYHVVKKQGAVFFLNIEVMAEKFECEEYVIKYYNVHKIK